MINKEIFYQEVNDLNNRIEASQLDKSDFDLLYELAEGIKNINSVDRKFFANKIMKALFFNGYTEDIMIPLKFLNSEIGKCIIKLLGDKIEKELKIYRVKDLTTLTGVTRAYIYEEIQNGNLQCYRDEKNHIRFTEDMVNSYLIRKKLKSLDQINEDAYKEVKETFYEPNFERECPYGE